MTGGGDLNFLKICEKRKVNLIKSNKILLFNKELHTSCIML